MMGVKKYLSILLAVLLVAGILPAGTVIYAAGETNYIVNGDFETDAELNWKADNWTVSTDLDAYTWLDTSVTKVLRIKAAGKAVSGRISQEVQGLSGGRLPDGIYTLEAQVQGDPAEISSLKLFAENTGETDVIGENVVTTTMAAEFYVIKLENITVTAGSCTVGLEVETNGALSAWEGALDIDNVKFYKTAEITNYITNGDFETDADSDWKADNWTASDNIKNYVYVDTLGTKVLKIMATGEAVTDGTVYQVVQGLPDGVYTLRAQVQVDSSNKEKLNSLKLYAQNTGVADVVGENVANTSMAGAFYEIKLKNIEVAAGSCMVGLEVGMNGNAWDKIVYIDNVMFYKTGELSGPLPAIVSVDNPAPITTVVNQAPVLPAKATARLSNGKTSEVAVTWSSVDSALYTGAGKIGSTFTVQGTVRDNAAGKDITVEISVTVTCKPFDLNGDGKVNVGDLSIAAYNYGKKSGDDGWDGAQAADVNGDGEVNTVDCQLISGGILGR